MMAWQQRAGTEQAVLGCMCPEDRGLDMPKVEDMAVPGIIRSASGTI